MAKVKRKRRASQSSPISSHGGLRSGADVVTELPGRAALGESMGIIVEGVAEAKLVQLNPDPELDSLTELVESADAFASSEKLRASVPPTGAKPPRVESGLADGAQASLPDPADDPDRPLTSTAASSDDCPIDGSEITAGDSMSWQALRTELTVFVHDGREWITPTAAVVAVGTHHAMVILSAVVAAVFMYCTGKLLVRWLPGRLNVSKAVATIVAWAVGLMVVAAVALGLLFGLGSGDDRSGASEPAAPPSPPPALTRPRPKFSSASLAPRVIASAESKNADFELHENGAVDQLANDGTVQHTFQAPAGSRAQSMTMCGRLLYVIRVVGDDDIISAIEPNVGYTGLRYVYSVDDPGMLACDQGALWATKPMETEIDELRIPTLTVQHTYQRFTYITAIAPGNIGGQHALWAMDALTGQMTGFARIDGVEERVPASGYYHVTPGATAMIYAGHQMRFLYPGDHCLRSFSADGDLFNTATPLPAGADHLNLSDGTLLVSGGDEITLIDSFTTPPSTTVIHVPGSGLIGSSEYANQLTAVEGSGRVLSADVAGDLPAGAVSSTACAN